MKYKLWLDDCRPAPMGWDWHLHVDTMIDDMMRDEYDQYLESHIDNVKKGCFHFILFLRYFFFFARLYPAI